MLYPTVHKVQCYIAQRARSAVEEYSGRLQCQITGVLYAGFYPPNNLKCVNPPAQVSV